MRKSVVLCAVLACAVARTSEAGVRIQELFDGSGEVGLLTGAGPGLTSSIGFAAASVWKVNAGNMIFLAHDFDLESDPKLPGLPPQQGTKGGLWLNSGGDWDRGSWATRPLDAAAQVNFAQDRTLYFSVRVNNAGDSAMGIGFAAGDTANAPFAGVGAMWNNYGPNQNARNSLYATAGVLSGEGPYVPAVFGPANGLDGKALILGRLTLSANGVDHLDVTQYGPGGVINPNSIPWVISTDLDPGLGNMNATHLLLWMNGAYPGELDAIRIGDTLADVVPEPASLSLLGLAAIGMLRRRRA